MRRFVPALFLGLIAFAPFAIGCDLLKQKGADAGADGAVAEVTPAVTDTTAANTAAPTTTVAAPLNPATAHTAAPVVKTDGGVVADAGHADAAPAPTPTFPLAFDAGALKGFDAGLLRGFDAGGFKPPWQK